MQAMESRLPHLIGDERRLTQVLINLVKNALKFTRKGAIGVQVGFNPIEEELILHVEDSGVGISRSDFNKLFTRFGRLESSSPINPDGVGLGLEIVQRVVDANQGQIEVLSDGPGKGTLFILSMKMRFAED